MTVLWATEECYLRSWRFAQSHVKEERRDVMQRVFIPNWSSDEFEEFVKAIRVLVDELGQDLARSSKDVKECENAWKQVVWAEEHFWPHPSPIEA